MFSEYKDPVVTVLSVNPTSVTFSTGSPEFGLPAAYYAIVLRRLTGIAQDLCREYIDEHRLMVTAGELSDMISFNELEELSSYHIDVVAHHNLFSERVTRRTLHRFATPGVGKISRLTLATKNWPLP
jgi:hypothetical protein